MATLETLEGLTWDAPTEDATPLVLKCHRLRSKHIDQLSVEELRLLIGQEIGLRWLAPLAVDHVELSPFVAGDLYPGDLLDSLLRVPESYWADDSGSWLRLVGVVEQLTEIAERAATWRAATRGGA